MKIQNIANNEKDVYLFIRNEDGSLSVRDDKSFYPYYYEPTSDKESDAVSIYGQALKKIYCNKPSEVRKQKSSQAHEADIIYTKRYILDKIPTFEKSKTRIIYFDIEVQASELPQPKEEQQAKYPVSVITMYDNYIQKYKTFYIEDYESEWEMLEKFCQEIKHIKPDVMCLDPETIVKTMNGFKKIKNCQVGETLLSLNNQHNYQEAKITNKFNTFRDTLKFYTRTNNIIASFNHKFPVLNQNLIIQNDYNLTTLKKAEEITIDDYFLIPTNYIKSSGEFSSLHWLLGYYQADGTKGNNKRIEIKDSNYNCLLKAQEYLNNLNIKSTIKKYKNCYILYSIQSLEVINLISKIKDMQKNLIEYLNLLQPNEQLSFISGFIDGDGCLVNKHLQCGTIDKSLVDWTSYILWGVGIPNKISKRLGKSLRKDFYSLSIYQSKNNKELFCQHENKKEWLDYSSKCSLDVIPLKNYLYKLIKKWNLELTYEEKNRFWQSKETINREFALKLIRRLLIDNKLSQYKKYKLQNLNTFINQYIFEKIQDIKPNGKQKTIEISLDKYHIYIGNNILTHNCAWNSSFDYHYLYYRINDFPKKISSINQSHWRKGFEMPAGISIVDLMGLYAKYTLHKKDSYALMNVANDELDYEIEGDFDFTDIKVAKKKNILDVKKMVELNEKLNLFEYFDEIRLLTRCDWEDLPSEMRAYQWQSNNSKLIDMLALEEAKKLNIVLPSKNREGEKGDVEGAYRDTFGTGLYKDLAKVDLSGAYPQAIIDFCLSPENYVSQSKEDTIQIDVLYRESKQFKTTYHIKQDSNTILPTLTARLLKMKNELKNTLTQMDSDHPKYKQTQIAYDSRKALVNSAFGVFGMPYFRLYNADVADTITFLVRDLLHYVEKKLDKHNYQIRYIDTDSVFYQGQEDITSKLNQWAIEWGLEKYNNVDINIQFDYEGFFSSIFIQAMCRYRGRLERPKKGQKIETKGIQMKRRDTGKWVKSFQEKLYDMILDGTDKEVLLKWLDQQIEAMKNSDIRDISLPVKINKNIEDYKTTPKWLKPLEEAKKLVPEFNKLIGDRFYIIYCKSVEKIALGNKYYEHIAKNNVDWKAMIEKNILNILVPIFKGLNWSTDLLDLAESYEIILGSQYRNKLLENCDNFEELKKHYSAKEVKKRRKEKNKSIESQKKQSKEFKIKSEKIINIKDFPKPKNVLYPFKWPGNKKTLLSILQKVFKQSKCDSIYEAFAGSAVFSLNTEAKSYTIADTNKHLIDLWYYIKNNNKALVAIIESYDIERIRDDQDYYNEIRAKFNSLNSSIEKSALFHILLGSCTNNLARFNLKGEFNQTWGRRCVKHSLESLESKVSKFNILFQSYDKTKVNENTLLYLDPPYLLSNDCYTAGSWDNKEEEKFLNWLSTIKSKWCLSNIITKGNKENILLKEFAKNYNLYYLSKKYNAKVGGYSDKSKHQSQEVLITNFEVNLNKKKSSKSLKTKEVNKKLDSISSQTLDKA